MVMATQRELLLLAGIWGGFALFVIAGSIRLYMDTFPFAKQKKRKTIAYLLIILSILAIAGSSYWLPPTLSGSRLGSTIVGGVTTGIMICFIFSKWIIVMKK